MVVYVFDAHSHLGEMGGVGNIRAWDNIKLNNNLSRNKDEHYKWSGGQQGMTENVRKYEYGIKHSALIRGTRLEPQLRMNVYKNYQFDFDQIREG